jgi:hypothetical protein
MEGKTTTSPTMPDVHKGARQSNAQRQSETRHSVPKHPRMCLQHRLPTNVLQANGQTANGNEGSATARHGRKEKLDANRQERMIRADFIRALGWDWSIMPGKIMQSDQKEVEALETACCTADPCPGGV